MDLFSTENYVECPFVIIKLGKYTFGNYSGTAERAALSTLMKVDYPNFMTGISVRKINGQVNTYTVNMVYAITENDDPNMLEKVFSSVRDSREMILTYGDWNSAPNIYKEETALITSIKSNVSMSSSTITYTIEGVSNSLSLNSALYDFPARRAKPSDVVKEILYSPSYGLSAIFTGMTNRLEVSKNSLIASDDKVVDLEAKHSITALSYISYLVSSMVSSTNSDNSVIQDSIYQMCIRDDVNNSMGGPYFMVKKVSAVGAITQDGSLWEIDIGYPGRNFVMDFTVENDESWSLLYDYQDEINQSKYVYRIGDDGSILTEDSPSLVRNKRSKKITESNKQWWTLMTQFPITANLKIKGLVRPTILMDYIKINVFFYGRKHIYSGVYVIIQQDDEITADGFRTSLRLLRVDGDY